MGRGILLPISFIVIALLGELFLWNSVVLFSVLLVILAFIKHLMFPIKKELYWYFLISIFGAIVEVVLVNIGHGWTYTNPTAFGIPMWIPLFWGLVGTTIVVIYDRFKK